MSQWFKRLDLSGNNARSPSQSIDEWVNGRISSALRKPCTVFCVCQKQCMTKLNPGCFATRASSKNKWGNVRCKFTARSLKILEVLPVVFKTWEPVRWGRGNGVISSAPLLVRTYHSITLISVADCSTENASGGVHARIKIERYDRFISYSVCKFLRCSLLFVLTVSGNTLRILRQYGYWSQ